eukprot:NODE_8714_length_1474_cov_8.576095.p1 GENE.NODE_8714_length_1474_cov_8.576095~~NODE_8714_length_1474_cov_8.576095.p1  ORF type:complete len:408 (-),score=102.39 NODE_8714_length_1474_cov_8.576095:131-1354(-)
MPLHSSHVFASHIGHTGKTTLCYQLSCRFAQQFPKMNVLVIDFAEEGDLTKRLLGGLDNSRSHIETLFGGIFSLFSEADRGRWLWSPDINIIEHAIKVHTYNNNAPENLFLVSSGAQPQADVKIKLDQHRRICAKILNSLHMAEETWKLFCDTDGDRRPAAFTRIAYGLCTQAIVPLHLNRTDKDRTHSMLSYMHDMRMKGEISTRVLFVVWNMVNSVKDEPCDYNGIVAPFQMTKVVQSIWNSCNSQLFQVAQDHPDLFISSAADEQDFARKSTVLMRLFADNVLKPSEELGKPFSSMIDEIERRGTATIAFTSGPVQYSTSATVLRGADEAVQMLCCQLKEMSLEDCGGVGMMTESAREEAASYVDTDCDAQPSSKPPKASGHGCGAFVVVAGLVAVAGVVLSRG